MPPFINRFSKTNIPKESSFHVDLKKIVELSIFIRLLASVNYVRATHIHKDRTDDCQANEYSCVCVCVCVCVCELYCALRVFDNPSEQKHNTTWRQITRNDGVITVQTPAHESTQQ